MWACPFTYFSHINLKATNLHTSRKVEGLGGKHARLVRLRVVFITAICNAQWRFTKSYLFTEMMDGAKMMAHQRGCMHG